MEIPFRGQFDHSQWAFTLHFEQNSFAAFHGSDVPRLSMQATLRYSERHQGDALVPMLLELHGNLTRANGYGDIGAQLLPVKEVPLNLFAPHGFPLVNLYFVFRSEYIQLLEEERASTEAKNVNLSLHMWGIAAMIRSQGQTLNTLTQARQSPGEIVRFERFETDPSGQFITIERSAWVDRLLPGLGYRSSVLVELPLVKTPPIPEIYRSAVEALENARNAFDREDYRGAVKYGREVTEYLGNKSSDGSNRISSFCKEYLEPTLGETKSLVVDASLNSIRKMTSASSHATPFLVDRATAAYVIEVLALNLRYIATALR